MYPTGSPEWFYEKSQTPEMNKLNETIENRRQAFINQFSPEQLLQMDGKELLLNVFGDDSFSMMQLLMFDNNYRWFGAAGKYKYLGVLYRAGGSWKYKEGTNAESLSVDKAIEQAEKVRDQLIVCIDEIENIGIMESIHDYQVLQNKLEKVFFYKYPWAIKYYQMLYPQFFPGMYADKTLERALNILGLPYHGKANRILNAGEISLFIRKCDVNNIVFNSVYADEWGWDKECSPCQYATMNYKHSSDPVHTVNTAYYKTGTLDQQKKECEKQAKEIEEEISSLKLEGQARDTVVKARVNQGVFRKLLLKRYGKCCLCGIKIPELLIASHIKPWAVSKPNEKLDPDNGLLLCPNHDKLFDQGLITFDDKGSIIISDQLDDHDQVLSNIMKGMSIPITERNKQYLKYHRENRFNHKYQCNKKNNGQE